MYGFAGTGRNRGETLLEEVVNIISSGMRLEIADPTTAYIRAITNASGITAQMVQEALR
jgi:hypothetical protein